MLSRGGAVAARRAHNPEVAGSSPAPATMKNDSALAGSFFICNCCWPWFCDSSALLAIVAGSVMTSTRRSLLRACEEMCFVLPPLPSKESQLVWGFLLGNGARSGLGHGVRRFRRQGDHAQKLASSMVNCVSEAKSCHCYQEDKIRSILVFSS
jgi:hypothetical protein